MCVSQPLIGAEYRSARSSSPRCFLLVQNGFENFLVSPHFPSDSRGVAHQFEMVVLGDKLFK